MTRPQKVQEVAVLVHLILLELPVYQQGGLLVHLLCDGVSHRVVRLQASGKSRTAVFVIHVLFSISVEKTQRFDDTISDFVCSSAAV